jgi:hypothetical protein
MNKQLELFDIPGGQTITITVSAESAKHLEVWKIYPTGLQITGPGKPLGPHMVVFPAVQHS